MNFINNLKNWKDRNNTQPEEAEETTLPQDSEQEEVEAAEEEVVTLGTKIKVVAALAVVGFATYVAYWVQEPTDFKAQVIGPDSVTEEDAMAEEDAMTEDSMMESAPEEEAMIMEEETPTESVMVAQTTSSNEVEQEVAIIDFTFTPANITIEQGTTVVWTNLDVVDHTVTSDYFTSDVLKSGDSFSYTFEEAGTYDYFCTLHPQMKGKVTVSAGASAPTETLPETTEETTPQETEESLPTETLSPALLTTETTDTPTIVTIDPQELLEEEPEMENETMVLSLDNETEVRSAASVEESGQIAKSGPEDILYAGLFLGILYMNRRKLFPAKG
ncbi:MAG: cupredoxin family copper-binding protein [Candidatus Gracilibacteria bacterium]